MGVVLDMFSSVPSMFRDFELPDHFLGPNLNPVFEFDYSTIK